MNPSDWKDEDIIQPDRPGVLEPDSTELLQEAFVGPNAAHYLLAWDNMRERRWSWNWSAFFFGEGWLLYRRMYLSAVLFSLARLSLTPLLNGLILFTDDLLNQMVPLLFPYTMVLNIALGIYANHLYRIHAHQKISEAIREFRPERRLLGVKAKGGVSLLALLWIPVIAVVEQLLLFLTGNDFSFEWTKFTQSI